MKSIEYLNTQSHFFYVKGMPMLMTDVRVYGSDIGELSYKSSSLLDVLKLIAFISAHYRKFIFEIKKNNSNFVLLGAFYDSGFYIFLDDFSENNLIVFFPNHEKANQFSDSEILGFYDAGRELAYFLPENSAVNFEGGVHLIKEVLSTEDLSGGVKFIQTGEKVMKRYKEIISEYGLEKYHQ